MGWSNQAIAHVGYIIPTTWIAGQKCPTCGAKVTCTGCSEGKCEEHRPDDVPEFLERVASFALPSVTVAAVESSEGRQCVLVAVVASTDSLSTPGRAFCDDSAAQNAVQSVGSGDAVQKSLHDAGIHSTTLSLVLSLRQV